MEGRRSAADPAGAGRCVVRGIPARRDSHRSGLEGEVGRGG
ncbi:hypothetical protein QIT81_gp15 [Pseudomonas phage MR15]|uniref:Uncharacterized protein n=1 Tax=Pseudomonas phage MR15 TaxID=2711179 RepID=A0A6M3TDV8_9CAUD|nr:hypothetical protein QIT81_gp15 [Pseudomonas phage MR15]QJD55077.1 hypothetical protein Psm1vBMR13_gp15 [Pseudomonas phage MR13]QJD55229.1 hypothetical protein Psm1vBMR15_gp15 [Pseudomonas phage MR15]